MDVKDRTARMAARVAFFVLAERQPDDDLFGAAFAIVREKARSFKEQHEEAALESLKKSLINDLKGRDYEIVSVEMMMGKYSGSRFVTSARVKVIAKDKKDASSLVKHLQRYHPKYHLRAFDAETGVAEYNIR